MLPGLWRRRAHQRNNARVYGRRVDSRASLAQRVMTKSLADPQACPPSPLLLCQLRPAQSRLEEVPEIHSRNWKRKVIKFPKRNRSFSDQVLFMQSTTQKTANVVIVAVGEGHLMIFQQKATTYLLPLPLCMPGGLSLPIPRP